ncbi:MAG: tRNA lysidine(34) synthetase TilS [Pirellulales bacterium]|nr:tRNA lysidine(34) synthetase TilS [Pirellulales bacterium]
MTTEPHSFETALAAAWPPSAWRDVPVLLAVSGGADSMALLRGVCSLRVSGNGGLFAAHFHHGLRGEEADADEAFVVEACRRLDVTCQVGRAQARRSASHAGQGPEAVARRARYAFLRQTAARLGARYLATAHTADDQAETILHRVVRGTGIAGLSGIPRTRRLGEALTLIRPMLAIRRSELMAYLAHLGQTYRVDASNADRRFTRNRLRHALLPRLARHFNPNVTGALLRLGALAGEVQGIVDHWVDELLDGCAQSVSADRVSIETAPLSGRARYLIREAMIALWRRQDWPLRSMGHAEWEALASMATGSAGQKRVFPGGIIALRRRDHLVLSAASRPEEGREGRNTSSPFA